MATDTLNTTLLNEIMNPNLETKKLEDKNLTNMEEKNMPGDGNCMFWSAMMAYLEPVKNDKKEFEKKCEKLFGSENNNWKVIFDNFAIICTKGFEKNSKYQEIKNLMLVFRKNVIKCMSEKATTEQKELILQDGSLNAFNLVNKIYLEEKHPVKNFEEYCSAMECDGLFGDNLELVFISKFLECKITIFENNKKINHFDDVKFEEEIVLNYVNKNHYNYFSYAYRNSVNHEKPFLVTKKLPATPLETLPGIAPEPVSARTAAIAKELALAKAEVTKLQAKKKITNLEKLTKIAAIAEVTRLTTTEVKKY